MDIPALKIELAAGHPTTGAYSSNNKTARAEIRATNRPDVASPDSLRNYFLLETKNSMPLMGRLEIVAAASVGTDPLGEVTLTLIHITTAIAMVRIVNPSSQFRLDLHDARFESLVDDLAAGSGARIISPSDKTAIIGLSNNLQSRDIEIGLGKVKVGHIQQARA